MYKLYINSGILSTTINSNVVRGTPIPNYSNAWGAISMGIYFKPTWLYIKRHKNTGLMYFGKTVRDPARYTGSGKRWKNHINIHGKDHVETMWCCKFHEKEDLIEFATLFSEFFDIVESSKWANLCPENGIDGGYRYNNHCKVLNTLPRTLESNIKRSNSLINVPKSEEHCLNMSKSLTGIQWPKKMCPHCGVSMKGNIIYRYHYDNCKFIP